jgi:hypothetical protein
MLRIETGLIVATLLIAWLYPGLGSVWFEGVELPASLHWNTGVRLPFSSLESYFLLRCGVVGGGHIDEIWTSATK